MRSGPIGLDPRFALKSMSREKGITRHALGSCFMHVVLPNPLHTFGRHALSLNHERSLVGFVSKDMCPLGGGKESRTRRAAGKVTRHRPEASLNCGLKCRARLVWPG